MTLRAVSVGLLALLAGPALAQPLAICGGGKRVTCVVDGDTFWVDGEKVRIADIDTPEIEGGCGSERERAALARDRLADLLGADPFTLRREGQDRYGRTLAVIANRHGSIGEVLIGEGLARRWDGGRHPWC